MEERLRNLLLGSESGPKRARIILVLDQAPVNTNQIADRLDLNYNTVRYHLRVLREQGIVESGEERYGQRHFLTEQFEHHWDEFARIVDDFD